MYSLSNRVRVKMSVHTESLHLKNRALKVSFQHNMRVHTIVCETLIAATPHGVDEGYKILLGQCLPLCLQHLEQVLAVCGRYMVVSHLAVQLIPNVLNRVKVRTACWPVHPADTNLLQVGVHDLCPVGSCIVILVQYLWSHLT